MKKIAVIYGYGPGIGHAVALKFGQLGYTLALVSRTQAKLDVAASLFGTEHKISAHGFAANLLDPNSVRTVTRRIQGAIPHHPIGLAHWNVAGGRASALTGDPKVLSDAINAASTNLIVAVQTALEDLKQTRGTVLATGSGLGLELDSVAEAAADRGNASLAIAKAAMRKTTHLLHLELKPLGVYAGEVTVAGPVESEIHNAEGGSVIRTGDVADLFLKMSQERTQVWETISPRE
ncbi:hypothetical protein HDU98_012040 [Podochytrium sp. JEL0797]|nr:hypothetical protein HDU98_012040 [Podochytrium sp. JEL0797]